MILLLLQIEEECVHCKKPKVTLTIFLGYLSCTRVVSLSEVPGMLLKWVS